MSEDIFRSILGEALEHDLVKYQNVPEHRFSLKHKIAVKRIFSVANYPHNSSKILRAVQKHSLKQSLIIAAVIVFLAVI